MWLYAAVTKADRNAEEKCFLERWGENVQIQGVRYCEE